jgi:thiamine monophosphate kinase
MTLRLANNSLTRYVTRSGYATAESVPLTGALGEVAATLLAWLGQQLAQGETLADVVLEQGGQVATAFDDEGTATAYRPVITAAVSVSSTLGLRTFIVSSETLPQDLRDGLLASWKSIFEL